MDIRQTDTSRKISEGVVQSKTKVLSPREQQEARRKGQKEALKKLA